MGYVFQKTWLGTKIGALFGTLVGGGTMAVVGTQVGLAAKGAVLGTSVLGPLGTAMGAVMGAVAGAVTGILPGAAFGASYGLATKDHVKEISKAVGTTIEEIRKISPQIGQAVSDGAANIGAKMGASKSWVVKTAETVTNSLHR